MRLPHSHSPWPDCPPRHHCPSHGASKATSPPPGQPNRIGGPGRRGPCPKRVGSHGRGAPVPAGVRGPLRCVCWVGGGVKEKSRARMGGPCRHNRVAVGDLGSDFAVPVSVHSSPGDESFCAEILDNLTLTTRPQALAPLSDNSRAAERPGAPWCPQHR